MTDSYVDPNSGAAPQPGGYAGPQGVALGHGMPQMGQPVDAPEEAPEPEEETPEEEVVDQTPSDDDQSDQDDDADGGDDSGDDDEKQDDDSGEEAVVAYDPSEYSIPEVHAYLEANPDQSDAVIAAEKAGKNRKGITGE